MSQPDTYSAVDKAALINLLIDKQVLKFGDFTLKSGRQSPYFFNLGALDTGSAFAQLASAYAACITRAGITPAVLFGPAYKGIPIATATAVVLAQQNPEYADIGVAYNRKEAKTHGEGGQLVGADLQGKDVLLVDDVLTAGTAIREAVALVEAGGGRVTGVVIAMDRQERGPSGQTAVAALSADIDNVPVLSLLSLQDVMDYLAEQDLDHKVPPAIRTQMASCQAQYCAVS